MLRIALAMALALSALACQPSPTTPPLTPSASAATAETADPDGGWTPIELPDEGETWFAGGTVADSSGFLVFGGIGDKPAVWASSDGLDWHSAALPFGFGFPSEAAASLDATVLLGAGSTSRCAHPFGQSLWRRAAGADVWESVPFVEQLFCAGGFEEVAAAQHGFAVVGTGTGDQPFAWQSADGLAWHDASQGLPVNSPPNLLAAYDGGFIELGRGERTDVRTSVDGARWAPAEAPPVPPAFNGDAIGTSPSALIATNAGVLAVYQAEGAVDRSAWLREADGSWRQVPMTGVEPGDIVAGGFGIGDDAYLFLGRGNAAALMTSRDLLSWNEVAIPPAGSILDLAVIRDRIVLVTHKLELGGDVTRVFVNVRPPGGG